MSSEFALNIPADMVHYGATKTADLTLSRGLAKSMAGTGVTVNAVLPGPTLSEGVREMLRAEQERSGKPVEEVAVAFMAARRPSSIIRHAATVEEVANLVVYVASPLAPATTGRRSGWTGAWSTRSPERPGDPPASATTPTLSAGANRARSTGGGGSATPCVGSWTGIEETRARIAPTLNGRPT